MATVFPGALDTFTDPISSNPLNSPNHANEHANANDSLLAIETALGTNPQGSHTDVKSRLSADEVLALAAIIDGGGVPFVGNEVVYLRVPFACTIQEFTLLADVSGSITVEVLNDTYANYPPAADISAGGLAIVAALKNTNLVLAGWTVALGVGTIIGFKVIGASTNITRVTVQLKVLRS